MLTGVGKLNKCSILCMSQIGKGMVYLQKYRAEDRRT